MKLRLFLLLAFAGCMGVAHAQPMSSGELRLKFRLGRVVLASGDTLDGPVALQFGPDLLFLAQPDGSVRTFAPVAVAACAVQQEITGPVGSSPADPTLVRLFRALPRYPHRNRKQPEYAFFEQLGSGPVLLLRRQQLAQRSIAYVPVPATIGAGIFSVPVGTNSRGLPPPAPPRYVNLPELREEFYLIRTPDDLAPLRPGLKEFLGAFPTHALQLQAYARAHRLNASNARELTELVAYANALTAKAAP